MDDPTGGSTYSYDDRDALRTVTNPDQRTISYGYDAVGPVAAHLPL